VSAAPQFNALLADDLTALDRVIRARLHSEVLLVRQVAEYIIHSGGKRLRPALVLLSAKALGYEGDRHLELAAVVEFIHTATLLHDDVVDDSELRRGQDTANARFGNATSVLVGDFLYSRAFQMMVSVQNMRVMEVLADATNTIAEGEVLQLMNCHDPDVDEASYMRVIRYKTARLFDAAGRLGAILSGQPREVEDALGDYGMHLGTAFQLIDDVLDYSGDKDSTGKNVGDDLAEGKPTLPLLYVIRNGSAEQSERVRQAIARGGTDDFPAILAAIRDTGALEYTRQQAQIESDAAAAAISALPHGVYRDALLELPAFAVNRNY
jgi:octaprenyl-diphosphate synthase